MTFATLASMMSLFTPHLAVYIPSPKAHVQSGMIRQCHVQVSSHPSPYDVLSDGNSLDEVSKAA